MKKQSSLGTRCKNYEKATEIYLTRRTPVIIRLDGVAFHTLTKGMNRPFDDDLIECMTKTTQSLVKNIEGCEFGYTQSDEITLLLTDYKRLETQAWFDYRKSKIESVAASMATAYFNHEFMAKFPERYDKKPAFFDARAFNVPREDVVNVILWRQQDCTRNSIQMVGQSKFSHKELHGKSCNDIQEMLWQTYKINWNDIETHKKRGTCVYKDSVYLPFDKIYKTDDPCPECGQPINQAVVLEPPKHHIQFLDCPKCSYEKVGAVQVEKVKRTEYKIDKEIPIFTKDRDFIQKWVDVEEK